MGNLFLNISKKISLKNTCILPANELKWNSDAGAFSWSLQNFSEKLFSEAATEGVLYKKALRPATLFKRDSNTEVFLWK